MCALHHDFHVQNMLVEANSSVASDLTADWGSCCLSLFSLVVNACIQEQFEDTKGVVRGRTSKDRQYNGYHENHQKKNKALQNTTQKTNDTATQTPLNSNALLWDPQLNIGYNKNEKGKSRIKKAYKIEIWNNSWMLDDCFVSSVVNA